VSEWEGRFSLIFLGGKTGKVLHTKVRLPFVLAGEIFEKKKSINHDDASRRDEHEANYR